MIKGDLDTRIDDERRKTGTTFIGSSEKTRYENEALRDISRNADLDTQETTNSFSFTVTSGNSAVNLLSAVAPTLKDRKAIISLVATSAFTHLFSHVRPEDFHYLRDGNFWAISGNELWVRYNGSNNDTLQLRYYTNYVAQTSGGSLSSSLTSNSDEPILDEDYQEAIIQFALWKVFKKEGKKDDAKEAQDRYREILKDIMMRNESRRSYIFDRMTVEDLASTPFEWRIGRT